MPANPNDGTQLLGSGGDVITDEYIDPNAVARLLSVLSAAGYKIPRSKISVGPYGIDGGDATDDYPLPVDSRGARQAREIQGLMQADQNTVELSTMQRSSGGRVALIDNRGNYMASRGGGIR